LTKPPLKPNQKIPTCEYPQIAEYRSEGQTFQTIADHYGVTKERIRQILEEHFPEITTKQIRHLRKQAFDEQREGETVPCRCGCGALVPKWKKYKDGAWRGRASPYHFDRTRGVAGKLRRFLKEHPEGATVSMIVKGTGLSHPTVYRYVKEPKYRRHVKLNVHRGDGPQNPYVVSLAEEEI